MDHTDANLLGKNEPEIAPNVFESLSRTRRKIPVPEPGPSGSVSRRRVSLAASSDTYDTDNSHLGVALIFNHNYFDDQSQLPEDAGNWDRPGTEYDYERLCQVLKAYRFDVRAYEDLTFSQIIGVLEAVSKEDHSDNDCLLVAVMTHGTSGRLCAFNKDYPVETLWEMFLGSACKSLIGKPKLFFIQDREDSEIHLETLKKENRKQSVDNVDSPLGPKFSIPSHTDLYETNHPNLGVALIFNHKVVDGQAPRQGTDRDKDRLRKTLLAFGFATRTYEDKTFGEINDILESAAKEDHSQNDCLCVAVMSHGMSGKVFAKDMAYPVERLWKPFLGTECKTLINKPKIFFIQACRGEKFDSGVQFRGYTTMSRDATDSRGQQVTYTIPSTADLLVMYSTFDESFSWRNPTNGSWFIQSLCAELEKALKSAEPTELFRLLTAVSRRVAYEYQSNVPNRRDMDEMKEMPNFVSTLTKMFYIRPKNE